ncbi:MAG: TerC family protein [Candidatus Levyibacteriota bacterium]
MENLGNPAFWLSLGEIMLVNILLSGDNAVMIALAARSLPPHQQKKAIIGGSIAAVVILVVLTVAAAELLEFPYLRLVGSLLLFWIAVQLLVPEDEEEEQAQGSSGLLSAVRTILVANLVMSLDNVLGVAAVAQGRVSLLIAGLGISIPVIVFGSTLVLKLMTRFPVIITFGAALLGWVAADMFISDPAIAPFIASRLGWAHFRFPLDIDFNLVQALGAAMVIVVGRILASRAAQAAPAPATAQIDAETEGPAPRLRRS